MTRREWIIVIAGLLPFALRAGESGTGRITLENFEPAKLGAAIFAETNRVREAQKLPRLRQNNRLTSAADNQASAMALQQRVTHAGPYTEQSNAFKRVVHAGLDPETVAENVSGISLPLPNSEETWGNRYEKIAEYVVQAWMDSPGHRVNMLSRWPSHLGCAARMVRTGGVAPRIFSAQVFMREKSPST